MIGSAGKFVQMQADGLTRGLVTAGLGITDRAVREKWIPALFGSARENKDRLGDFGFRQGCSGLGDRGRGDWRVGGLRRRRRRAKQTDRRQNPIRKKNASLHR